MTDGSSGPTLGDQVTKLYEILAGYHATHLLEIGRELGVWDHLTAHPGSSSSSVAKVLALEPFYTDALCKTAFSAGIVDRGDEGWVMAPHMDVLLGSPGSTFDFSRAARAHMVVGEDYARYAEAFRAGRSFSYQEHDPTFMLEVALALQSLPRIFLEAVLPQLEGVSERFDTARRFLDVGCGGGWAIAAFAERYPAAEVVGVEVEEASVALARQLIEERDLARRCRVVHGDASQFDSGDEFDVASLFLVYHEIDPSLKRDVLRSIREALRSDGLLILFDETMPVTDEGLRSMPTRFSALAQWYELTWGNVIGTRDEVVEDFTAAGFEITNELQFSRFHIFVASPLG